MFNNSVNFKDTKNVDHILENPLVFQSLIYALDVISKFSRNL